MVKKERGERGRFKKGNEENLAGAKWGGVKMDGVKRGRCKKG